MKREAEGKSVALSRSGTGFLNEDMIYGPTGT